MTTEKQIEANRQNAQDSTGPKTEEGKSVSRMNALKHGILSEEVLMEGEEKASLEELGKRLRTELAPHGELEGLFVDRIVSSAWRLKRAIHVEREFLKGEYEECKDDDFNFKKRNESETWNRVVHQQFGESHGWLNLVRYETTLERQIYKALHELQRLQSARRGEKPPLPVAVDVEVSEGD